MNVTLVNSSRGARPFSWANTNALATNVYTDASKAPWSTSIPAPSNGKLKDALYSTFQGIVQGTAGTVTATITFQGTNDDFTGVGVQIPVVLTNASTTVTVPTYPYQITILAGGQPVGVQTVNIPGPQSFFDVPVDYNVSEALLPAGPQGSDRNRVTFGAGMLVYGPGLGAGTSIASVTNAQTMVLNAAPTGLPTSPGIYYINVTNPYWATTVLGTVTLSGTLFASDMVTYVGAAKYVRANVTAITGTNAVAYAIMGV